MLMHPYVHNYVVILILQKCTNTFAMHFSPAAHFHRSLSGAATVPTSTTSHHHKRHNFCTYINLCQSLPKTTTWCSHHQEHFHTPQWNVHNQVGLVNPTCTALAKTTVCTEPRTVSSSCIVIRWPWLYNIIISIAIFYHPVNKLSTKPNHEQTYHRRVDHNTVPIKIN